MVSFKTPRGGEKATFLTGPASFFLLQRSRQLNNLDRLFFAGTPVAN